MNISIVQDSCAVEEDEEFLIILEGLFANGFIQENRINLDTTLARVVISDDDGKCVCYGFSNSFANMRPPLSTRNQRTPRVAW